MNQGHHCARPDLAAADAASLLALFLWDEAADESVRVQEALAAAIANQVRFCRQQSAAEGLRRCHVEESDSARALQFINCLRSLGRRDITPPPAEDPRFASCRRIAGRAVSGALKDPTGGAVRFHRLGASPTWVKDLQLGPLIGSHLFYHDTTQDSRAA